MTTCVLEAVWLYKKYLCRNTHTYTHTHTHTHTHRVGFLSFFFMTLKAIVPFLFPY